eukprot:478777-Rhodomonas_salina.3
MVSRTVFHMGRELRSICHTCNSANPSHSPHQNLPEKEAEKNPRQSSTIVRKKTQQHVPESDEPTSTKYSMTVAAGNWMQHRLLSLVQKSAQTQTTWGGSLGSLDQSRRCAGEEHWRLLQPLESHQMTCSTPNTRQRRRRQQKHPGWCSGEMRKRALPVLQPALGLGTYLLLRTWHQDGGRGSAASSVRRCCP